MEKSGRQDKSEKSKAIAHTSSKKKGNSKSTFQFVDNRPGTITQRKRQEMVNNSASVEKSESWQAMATQGIVQRWPVEFESDEGQHISLAPANVEVFLKKATQGDIRTCLVRARERKDELYQQDLENIALEDFINLLEEKLGNQDSMEEVLPTYSEELEDQFDQGIELEGVANEARSWVDALKVFGKVNAVNAGIISALELGTYLLDRMRGTNNGVNTMVPFLFALFSQISYLAKNRLAILEQREKVQNIRDELIKIENLCLHATESEEITYLYLRGYRTREELNLATKEAKKFNVGWKANLVGFSLAAAGLITFCVEHGNWITGFGPDLTTAASAITLGLPVIQKALEAKQTGEPELDSIFTRDPLDLMESGGILQHIRDMQDVNSPSLLDESDSEGGIELLEIVIEK